MRKIPKIAIFCLSKAKILAILFIFAFNIATQEAAAAWSSRDIMALLGKNADDIWLSEGKNEFLLTGRSSILALNIPVIPKTTRAVLTAYSSTPDQTDNTPFITASGTRTRDGIVASNFLAFGTKIKIPELFGDKEFTVEDRMAKKHDGKIDIWFPERRLAKKFGIQEADVIILD